MRLTNRPKATLYALNCYGQVYRDEGRLEGYGRHERWAQHTDVPWVSFIDKGKRTPWIIDKTNFARYILVLAGHSHPEPPKPVGWNAWHDPDHLRDFDRKISSYIAESGVEVLVDYRDVRDMEVAIRDYRQQQAEQLARSEAFINSSGRCPSKALS